MIETLHNARKLDRTRVKRAFGWIVTFRDFPEGSWQTVDGDSMMTEALTFFTKGRAKFSLDGEPRADRIPGILSSEHEVVGQGGTFKLEYVEPTSRVCIPAKINRGKLPNVTQQQLEVGDTVVLGPGAKILLCLGELQVGERVFKAEETISVVMEPKTFTALSNVLFLDFTNAQTAR